MEPYPVYPAPARSPMRPPSHTDRIPVWVRILVAAIVLVVIGAVTLVGMFLSAVSCLGGSERRSGEGADLCDGGHGPTVVAVVGVVAGLVIIVVSIVARHPAVLLVAAVTMPLAPVVSIVVVAASDDGSASEAGTARSGDVDGHPRPGGPGGPRQAAG